MITSTMLKDELTSIEIKPPYQIPTSALERRGAEYIKLYGQSDSAFVYGLRNKEYDFEYTQPIYCHTISISAPNNINLRGLKITCIDIHGEPVTYTCSKDNNSNVTVRFDRITSKITLSGPSRTFNKIKLRSISVKGYQQMDFKALEKNLNQLNEVQKKANAAISSLADKEKELEQSELQHQQKIKELETQEETLGESISELTSENNRLTTQHTELQKKAANVDSQLQEKSTRLFGIESEVDSKTYTRKRLIQDIDQKEKELKALLENKNILAYEVGEFIMQGNRNTLSYIALSFIPWLLIAYITFILFEGGLTILNASSALTSDETLRLILSRIPIVLLASTIVIASYEFSKIFVRRIIEFHREKLAISRLGIIAKDVSDSSLSGLGLDDETKYNFRTKLKMDLLKSHLRKDIDEEYEYSIDPSPVGFLSKYFPKTNPSRPKNNDTNPSDRKESADESA